MCNLTFKSEPRISESVFAHILESNHSPAAPFAAALYVTPILFGIDPAIALAFFAHESSFGKSGIATRSKNWGNIRKSQGRAIHHAEGFAFYRSWEDGLRDWSSLINRVYIEARGLTTVGKALPVYAPAFDKNRPAAYALAVCSMVARWQAFVLPVE
jgi:hypothetical protein